ncbi:hypothetical protein Hanom_Chr02g00146401 [Helianthus anomalus]
MTVPEEKRKRGKLEFRVTPAAVFAPCGEQNGKTNNLDGVRGGEHAKKPKHQGVKWLFLKVWSKTVKMTKPHGVKRKFTLSISLPYHCNI